MDPTRPSPISSGNHHEERTPIQETGETRATTPELYLSDEDTIGAVGGIDSAAQAQIPAVLEMGKIAGKNKIPQLCVLECLDLSSPLFQLLDTAQNLVEKKSMVSEQTASGSILSEIVAALLYIEANITDEMVGTLGFIQNVRTVIDCRIWGIRLGDWNNVQTFAAINIAQQQPNFEGDYAQLVNVLKYIFRMAGFLAKTQMFIIKDS